jgi:hypothetical protein
MKDNEERDTIIVFESNKESYKSPRFNSLRREYQISD